MRSASYRALSRGMPEASAFRAQASSTSGARLRRSSNEVSVFMASVHENRFQHLGFAHDRQAEAVMPHARFMQHELFFARKVGRVGCVPDDFGRDEDEQVGLVRLLVAGLEQPSQSGNAAEPRNFALVVGLLIVEEAADDRRLAVLQQDGRLDQALAGGRGDDLIPVGEGDEALRDPADFLFHLKAERAVVADARGNL